LVHLRHVGRPGVLQGPDCCDERMSARESGNNVSGIPATLGVF
jgi:hypothetical protein